jgi:hypothetical protein
MGASGRSYGSAVPRAAELTELPVTPLEPSRLLDFDVRCDLFFEDVGFSRTV